ncbi:MAG TPA: energy transducer TonB [Opitutaceae bacterium]|nr:energy transducer TonB [Opitutaceae bacterium]
MKKLSILLLCSILAGCVAEPANHESTPGAGLAPSEPPDVVGAAPSTAENRPPKALAMRNPEYPFELKRNGVQAVIPIEFVVGVDGRAHDVRVFNSPDPRFDDAIMAAAADWRFEPGIRNGKPVNTKLRTSLTFSLSSQ